MNNVEIIGIANVQVNSDPKKALGIGYNNELLHPFDKDMQFFSKITKDTGGTGIPNGVIMGGKNFLTIPKKFRPLAGRTNYVITQNPLKLQEDYPGIYTFSGSTVTDACIQALNYASQYHKRIYVIGGEPIYAALLPYMTALYLTFVEGDKEADRFFPSWSKYFELVTEIAKGSFDDGRKWSIQHHVRG